MRAMLVPAVFLLAMSCPALTSAPEEIQPALNSAPEEVKLGPTGPPEEDQPDPEPATNRTAFEWYSIGVRAYLDNAFADCERSLNNAIDEWRYLRKSMINCRIRCAEEARSAPRLFQEDIENLHYGEEMVRKTLCLIKCKREAFKDRKVDSLTTKEEQVFLDLRPYEYLQLCYYQRHKYQEAASSVFTFLVQHPDDEVMRSNLNYYLTLTEVDRQKIVNFEAENFVPLYIVGTEAYIREDYESTINHLEESLEEYLKSEEECRADCEGPFDQGWLPDFTSSVSNHFVYCLKCKQRCRFQLGNLNGETYNDLLPSHYHYLQFAYYKLGKISEACGAAATYLLFFPTDETMQSNMEFYKNLPEVEENMFKPRNEAVLYTKRQEYEVRLLSYIADEFVFPEGQVKEEEPRPEETMTTRNENNNNAMKKSFPSFLDSLSTKTMSQAQIGEYHWSGCSRDQCNDEDEKKMVHSMNTQNRMLGTEEGVTSASYKEEKEDENITTAWEENKETECLHLKLYNSVQRKVYNLKQENQLSGKMRFSLDGLADELECQRLVQLAQMAGVQGDGYKANKSPHSSLEKFEGLSLGRAALMVHFGLLGSDILELFIRLSERGRNLTAHYFNVQEELYFSYTHLVCRTALPGRPANASLLSHPIHADNCLLLQNGDCLRRDPAYTWRDFSAILYLNDDFEGGEFIFSADPLGKVIQSSIKPKCGRMVGFSAGEENLHGVKGVQQGQRCAIGLWFTLDPQHSEWGRILAEHMLNDMKTHGTSSEWVLDELQNLVNFDLSTAQLRIQELQATEQCSNQNTDSTTPTLLDGKLHSTKLTST